MSAETTPERTLLGWAVPEHVQFALFYGPERNTHVGCTHEGHGNPSVDVFPDDRDLQTQVGHFLRDHAHGVSVEYRPEPRQAETMPLGEARRVASELADAAEARRETIVEQAQTYELTEENIDVAQLRARIAELEELCEIGSVNQDVAAMRRELEQAREDVEEARSWACHGYEIGQRSCTWSDQGVAPRWLIDSYRVPASSVAVSGAIAASPEGEGGEGQNEAQRAAEPVDRKLLHENVRFAIADPGHFLPRKAGEPVSHWSARAVMDVLGVLGTLGAPGNGYAYLPSSPLPDSETETDRLPLADRARMWLEAQPADPPSVLDRHKAGIPTPSEAARWRSAEESMDASGDAR